LVHLHESNDVNSLVIVVENLEGTVQIVVLDRFLKLAARKKAYKDPVPPKG
tara:strand:- start:532 stop:684 length:153 start_codon:yes stop_codon:yes gene_type:complete